jgi:hypothetical protein
MPTSAQQLARAYDRYVSAVWRGETEATHRFAAWLRGCWGLGAPPEPPTPPAAVSALGGAGASIRWHETPDAVYGYIPGVPLRCYQIPRDADVPDVSRESGVRSQENGGGTAAATPEHRSNPRRPATSARHSRLPTPDS